MNQHSGNNTDNGEEESERGRERENVKCVQLNGHYNIDDIQGKNKFKHKYIIYRRHNKTNNNKDDNKGVQSNLNDVCIK